jgi:hypothetical protein
MARNKEMLSKVEEEIDRLQKQISGLQHELAAAQRIKAMLAGESAEQAQPRIKNRNVKDTVLGLLANASETGLTVNEVLEHAESQGKHLDRGSVSSLLSRLKREAVLDLVDGSYRVKNPSAAVVQLRKAGSVFD